MLQKNYLNKNDSELTISSQDDVFTKPVIIIPIQHCNTFFCTFFAVSIFIEVSMHVYKLDFLPGVLELQNIEHSFSFCKRVYIYSCFPYTIWTCEPCGMYVIVLWSITQPHHCSLQKYSTFIYNGIWHLTQCILWEPVLSEHPVLSGHEQFPRGSLLN